MQLPDEILGAVFLLVDSHDIDQKFRLTQVCAKWRNLGLQLRRMWCTFAVRTPLDASRVPVVLDRGGCTSLDVELLWYHQHHERLITLAARRQVADMLVASRDRIKRLFVDHTNETTQPLERLLSNGVGFPMLEELKMRSAGLDESLELAFTAPLLKVLDVRHQGAREWPRLLGPSLTHVSLERCYNLDVTFIELIFRHCPALQSLTFHQYEIPINFGGFDQELTRLVPPHLRTLNLSGTDACELVHVLRSDFHNVQKIIVRTDEGSDEDDIKQLTAEVLGGLDTLVSFRLVDDTPGGFELQDANGRSRRMLFWHEDPEWEWPDFWSGLARTIREFHIPGSMWRELAGRWAPYPPQAPGIELHIDLNTDDIDYAVLCGFDDDDYFNKNDGDFIGRNPLPRLLTLPGLSKVFFTDRGKYASSCDRSELVRLFIQYIDCADTARVEVCVSALGRDFSGEDCVEVVLPALFQGLLEEKWVPCPHCVSQTRGKAHPTIRG